MKIIAIAIVALALATPAVAGPYLGFSGAYQSVSLDASSAGRVPNSMTGYAVDAGWRFGKISVGGQYSSLSGDKNNQSLSASRYGIEAAYHFKVISGIDTDIQVDGGRTNYTGITSTFANSVTTRSTLFSGASNDWGVGLGAAIPIWRTLSIKLDGGYRASEFGGHASSGPVFGIGLVFAR